MLAARLSTLTFNPGRRHSTLKCRGLILLNQKFGSIPDVWWGNVIVAARLSGLEPSCATDFASAFSEVSFPPQSQNTVSPILHKYFPFPVSQSWHQRLVVFQSKRYFLPRRTGNRVPAGYECETSQDP